jgi:hypothetical protein
LRIFGLLGACLALFVGVALTVIPSAGADAPEPRITKCVRIFGYTVVQWDQAYLDEHYGKGSAFTQVQFHYSPFFEGSVVDAEIQGRSATAPTPVQAESVDAVLFINGGPGAFVTDSFDCSFLGNSHHLNRGRHVAKGRQR